MDKVYVSIWFDTEDYTDPRSDDAALRLARILTDLGAPGTFKLVGEKLRTLERRGRHDVIQAIARHDVGYHTDWHSRHPVVSEYLAEAGWDAGMELFRSNEGPGVEDVRRVFGIDPSCYGQAGAAWAPHAYAACADWGVPLYLDEGRHVVVENRPHFYCGAIAVYGLGPANARVLMSGADALDRSKSAFDQAVEFARTSGGGVVNVYYHPWEFVSVQAPDAVNYANGENPPDGDVKLPRAFSAEEIERGFSQFRDYVEYMLARADVQLVTGRQLARAYRDRAAEAPLDAAQVAQAAGDFLDGGGFVRVNGAWLSPAELLYAVAAWFARTESRLDAGALPNKSTLGPKQTPPREVFGGACLEGEALAGALARLHIHLDSNGHVPEAWRVGPDIVSPEALLHSGCRLLIALVKGAELPKHVGATHVPLATEKYVAEDSEDLWRWVIHKPGFRAPRLMELARLQAWTIKPAVRA